MDEQLFRRSEQARADARRLVGQSQEIQERHWTWLRRVTETDDGLVVAIAKNREDRAKSEAGRQIAASPGYIGRHDDNDTGPVDR